MIRQNFAPWPLIRCGFLDGLPCFNFTNVGFYIFQSQRQLIGIKLFRAASKLTALQLFDDEAEALDFAIAVLKAECHITHQAV